MTRLEAVIERLKSLPEAEQESVALEIEALLASGASVLTPEQWKEVEEELDTDDGVRVPHAEVMERMRLLFAR